MDFDLVIFDCDGVLVDSEIISNELLRLALSRHGLEMSINEVIDTFVGRSMISVVDIAQRKLKKPLPNNFLDTLQKETFLAFERELRAVGGVEEVLSALKERCIPFCVASSGGFDKMSVTLSITGLDRFFKDRIFSASQVKRGKPYPDLFLYAAEQMQVEPARCLVIEDSVPGVQAAVSAGMEVLAYSVRGNDDALKKAGGLVIHRMSKVTEHLTSR